MGGGSGVRHILDKISFLLELFLNGTFILLYSLREAERVPEGWNVALVDNGISWGSYIVPVILLVQVVVNFVKVGGAHEFFRRHVFSLIVFVSLLIVLGDAEFTFWLASAHLLSTVLSLYDDPRGIIPKKEFTVRYLSLMNKLGLRPAQLVMISFGTVIGVGTFLLMLPVSRVDGNSLDFIDALFLATSATCVTGLTTLSIGSQLSLFGQTVILVLIQIGGLSIMTLYSSMTILLGKAMGVKGRIIMQDLLDVSGLEDLVVMIMKIIKYTIVIELWGAVVLTLAFSYEGHDFGQSLYFGIFHSVSAFCNAGLSLFDTSLESYGTTPFIHGTVAALVTLGGSASSSSKTSKRLFLGAKRSSGSGFTRRSSWRPLLF